ncbi:MAG: FG-GAP-like repeat-containing protein [Saprospiraceae bacterium]
MLLSRHVLPLILALGIACVIQAQTDTSCTVASIPSTFEARIAWESKGRGPSSLTTPVVGNMNPHEDDMPEIIALGGRNVPNQPTHTGFSNEIFFFRGDGSNKATPMKLTIQGVNFHNYPAPGPTIADVNNDGKPELLIICLDQKIRVYNNYRENPVAPMDLWIITTDLVDMRAQRPMLADFDSDGTPEVYVGSDIFRFNFTDPANPTLNKVLDGPIFWGANLTGQLFYQQHYYQASNPVAADLLTPADCNGDPDCNGLEIAAGMAIYSIDLDPNDGDGLEIKMQRYLQSTGQTIFFDGYTSVADIDLDGVLDVLVSSKVSSETGMYAWNKNGFLRFFPFLQSGYNSNGAVPCVANVFDDRTQGFAVDMPEILLTDIHAFHAFNIQASQKDPAAPYWWRLPTSGTTGSGYSPAVTFDFNGDGIQEILYGADKFRVLYGGAAPFPPGVDSTRTWHKFSFGLATTDKHPVIADVDNDNEAEIVFTYWPGYFDQGQVEGTSEGVVGVVESAEGPWMPTRKIWNQYNYFVVNVNDDLTIPAVQRPHHLEIPPGSGNRPLNQTLFQESTGRIPLPDASATLQSVFCQNDQVQVQVEVCNFGLKDLDDSIPVAFYATDPTATNAPLLGAVQVVGVPVKKDTCVLVDFVLPPFSGTAYGMVNDDGSLPRPFNPSADFPVNYVFECNWLNNIFQVDYTIQTPVFDLGPDAAACGDTAMVLHAGPGHLSYLWQDGSTDSTFLVQKPGWYWVRVQGHCIGYRTDSVLVEDYGFPQIQIDTINGDCNGNPASATVTVPGSMSFDAVWSSGHTGPIISGIPDNNYAVTVTDNNGCSSTASTWVEAGGFLEAFMVLDAIPCYAQPGLATISISAGNGPYEYYWSNGNATGSDTQTLQAGNYTVTTSDTDGCSRVLEFTMQGPAAPLSSNGAVVSGACPGVSNGTISFLGAYQGTAPYTILWSSGDTTPVLSGIPAGTYSLTITDANGCTLSETAQVPEHLAPTEVPTVVPITCFGANDGSISVGISGGTPGFSFVWSNGAVTPVVQNLGAGTYTLDLAFANGACAQTIDFQITEPLPLQSAGTNAVAACAGEANGSVIFLGAAQGTPPYALLWSNGGTTPDLTGLPGGVYALTVTDANGCSMTETATVAELDAPQVAGTVTMASCTGASDGAVALTVSGGTPGMAYQWSNGQAVQNISALGAGTYSLTLTYADGRCPLFFEFPVAQPQPLLSAGFTTVPACPGEANGSATFLGAAQGTPPYSLQWSTGATVPDLGSVPAGAYTFWVTDASGCTLSEVVQVPEHEAPLLTPTTQAVTCFGANDGSASVVVSGGTPGFSFAWSNGAVTPAIQNLGPGIYTLDLAFANGACAQMIDFQITEPLPLQSAGTSAMAACAGETNGSVTFLGATQGTPPYTLLWSNGGTAPGLTGLPSGAYTLTVTDANGCTLVESAQVGESVAPTVVSFTVPASCAGSSDGAVSLTVSGGTPGMAYQWSSGQVTQNIQSLSAGTYSLTLTYADGRCPLFFEFPVAQPQPILSAGFTTVPACLGQPNGTAVFLGASQGTPPYSLQWSTGATGPTLSGVPGSAYTLLVTDANGCTMSQAVQVPMHPLPIVLSTVDPISCFGADDGSISVAAPNGVGLTWSNGQALPQIQQLQPGVYALTVTYAGGACAQTFSFDLPEPVELLASGINVVAACAGQNNGSASFLGMEQGVVPFGLSWSNGGSTADVNGLASGTYTLTVTDATGCSLTISATVPTAQEPVLGTDSEDATCFGANNGSASVAPLGGGPVAAYAWSNGASGPAQTNLNPGTYTLTVTYGGGQCTLEFVFGIGQPPALLAGNEQVVNVLCHGDATGSVSVEALGGTAPYQFAWPGGQTGAALQAVPAGTYALTLTDANGCVHVEQYAIGQPNALVGVPQVRADTCGQGTGTALAVVSGGVLPYIFSWSNGAGTPAISGLPAGNYGLTISDANGCTQAATATVPDWNSTPTLAPYTDTITCAQPVAAIGVVGDQPGLHYTWTSPSGTLPDRPDQSVSLAGAYAVTAVNGFGCSATATITVAEDVAGPLADAGPVQVSASCDATEVALDASGSTAGIGFLPLWQQIIGGVPVFISNSLTAVATEAGMYVFSNRNTRNGCSASDTVWVEWAAPVVAEVAVQQVSCFGENDGSITVQHLAGGLAPILFSIDNQNYVASQSFQNLGPGTYPVLVRDALGCLWQTQVTLTQPPPIAVVLTATDTLIDLGQYVFLKAELKPPTMVVTKIEWLPALPDWKPGALNQRLRPEQSAEYAVQVTDPYGCTATDRVFVEVVNYRVYVPNAIAPGSADNGVLTVYTGAGIDRVRLLQVYDRWGSLVFENRNFAPNDPTAGWDGSLGLKPFGPGVFVWYAELEGKDGRVLRFNGDVTILR